MGSNTPSGAYYASVQDLTNALDFNESARNVVQMKNALAFATDTVSGELTREFFPMFETRKFDWPQEAPMPSWRLWLNQNELISLGSIVSGGVTIPTANVLLEPQFSGPPFNRLEINIGSSSFFQAGNTWQQSIAITGTWGYWANANAVTTLASGINASVTTLAVNDCSQIGIGNVILVDTEYMVVTSRLQITTGQTLQAALSASVANTVVSVTSGSSFNIGEPILLDAEQMLIVDIAGNNLIVKRAWNGSVLAAHSGSTVFAPRTLVVTRGTLGSTAAAHTTGATTSLHVIPPAVAQLTLAEAAWYFQGQASAWQTAVGDKSKNQPSLKNLEDLRAETAKQYGRKARSRAV